MLHGPRNSPAAVSLLDLAYYDVIGWPDGKRRSAATTEEAIEEAFDLLASGLRDYPRKAR